MPWEKPQEAHFPENGRFRKMAEAQTSSKNIFENEEMACKEN
jgi:hypothetical protein